MPTVAIPNPTALRQWFHHSSLLAGDYVAIAGEMEVHLGALQTVSNGSGHYLPSAGYLVHFLQQLRKERPFFDLSAVNVDIFTPDSSRGDPPTHRYSAHEFFRKALPKNTASRLAFPHPGHATLCLELPGSTSYVDGATTRTNPFPFIPSDDVMAGSDEGQERIEDQMQAVDVTRRGFVPEMDAGYGADGSRQWLSSGTQGAHWAALDRSHYAGRNMSIKHVMDAVGGSTSFGDSVKYLTPQEREDYRVRIRAGSDELWIGRPGRSRLLDTRGAGMPTAEDAADVVESGGHKFLAKGEQTDRFIFVMDRSGKIYAADYLGAIFQLNPPRACSVTLFGLRRCIHSPRCA